MHYNLQPVHNVLMQCIQWDSRPYFRRFMHQYKSNMKKMCRLKMKKKCVLFSIRRCCSFFTKYGLNSTFSFFQAVIVRCSGPAFYWKTCLKTLFLVIRLVSEESKTNYIGKNSDPPAKYLSKNAFPEIVVQKVYKIQINVK